MYKSYPKKVCLISYSLSGGGSERNIINLAMHLKKKGWITDIMLINNIVDYKEEYKKELGSMNIISIFEKETKGFKINLKNLFLLLKTTYSIIRKNNYDILVGGGDILPLYLSVFFAKLFKKKSVIVVSNNIRLILNEYYPNRLIRYLHYHLIKVAFLTVNTIICMSKGLASDVIDTFHVPSKKINAIYNGIDIKKIHKLKDQLLPKRISSFVKGHRVIVGCGRLTPQKGFSYLIRAFRIIHQSFPETRLLIMGKGPLEKDIKNLIQKLNLSSDAIMAGFVDNPYCYFKKSDIFVSSSLFEGFGNVIVEAMSCGVPVVAFDCSYGPREILSGTKYGILIPMKEGFLVKALTHLLKNNRLFIKYKEKSMERSKFFTLEKMGDSYDKALNRLLIQ